MPNSDIRFINNGVRESLINALYDATSPELPENYTATDVKMRIEAPKSAYDTDIIFRNMVKRAESEIMSFILRANSKLPE